MRPSIIILKVIYTIIALKYIAFSNSLLRVRVKISNSQILEWLTFRI